MSAAEKLLAVLSGVKQSAPGRWMARCPSHEDRSPSLAISEGNDGRALIHCFGGCSPSDVLDALGLELTDLFPERLPDHPGAGYRSASSVPASAKLTAIAFEIDVIAIIAAQFLDQRELTEVDWQRLATAVRRIRAVAHG